MEIESIEYNPLKDDYSSLSLMFYTTTVKNSNFNADQIPLLAARVSTAREGKTGENVEADRRLMDFLARHKHLSPFEHQYLTYRVVCPLFVAREWQRHRSMEGFWSFNEMSMRYTDDPVGKFYLPHTWRKQGSKNKQGSEGEYSEIENEYVKTEVNSAYWQAKEVYRKLLSGELAEPVAREMARFVVPVGNYTEFYVSASIRAYDLFCILRQSTDAQPEIRVYADALDRDIARVYPETWGVLQRNRNRLENILKSEYPDVWARLVAEKKV